MPARPRLRSDISHFSSNYTQAYCCSLIEQGQRWGEIQLYSRSLQTLKLEHACISLNVRYGCKFIHVS